MRQCKTRCERQMREVGMKGFLWDSFRRGFYITEREHICYFQRRHLITYPQFRLERFNLWCARFVSHILILKHILSDVFLDDWIEVERGKSIMIKLKSFRNPVILVNHFPGRPSKRNVNLNHNTLFQQHFNRFIFSSWGGCLNSH